MKITKRQLRSLIQEALTGPPETLEEWMYWGGKWNLDSDFDGDGQMMFYTYDQAMVDEAEKAGAAIERDNEGQFVIYTGAYDPNEEGF